MSNLTSIDVELLFTNVPIATISKIILNRMYNSLQLRLPTFPKEIIEELLIVCATKTHLIFGVTMVISLGSILQFLHGRT